MANNELDATFNLIAKDQGLETSITAGLKGLEAMLSTMVKFNEQLNTASKGMAQLRNAERVQTKAAPNERAIVGNQKTAETITRSTTITRDQTVVGSSAGPSALLAGTIARREQLLPVQSGRERVSGALQLSAAKELQTQLSAVDREAAKADLALKRLTVPVTPTTLASYDKLREEIADIERRLANNIQRGRFGAANTNVAQLADKTNALRQLPASNRAELAAQDAQQRDLSALNRRGIQRLEAEQIAEARDRGALTKRGIARLEAEQIAEARERERLNKTGIARLEADRLAEQRIRDQELKRQLAFAQSQQQPARIDKANQTRQNINDNLFGDGGASFASRIAGSYGIFQAVNGLYSALFGTLGLLKDFDSELANLKGIAAATDGQMVSLAKTILSVGTNTEDGRFGLSELAKASTDLAQAGFSTKEIEQSLNGFALLATASGSTLAQSVDVGTAALGSFQLQATEVGHVADVMAGSLNLTKLTMDKLGQGLQYVGTTAYESNLTLEETVALLGGLANSGIRSGSTLGTGLRQFLVDLKDPTTKLQKIMDRLGLTFADIDVKAHGVTGVMKRLADAGFTASDAYQGLEVRAAAAFLALRNQGPLVQELERSFQLSGAAADAAKAQMGSFASQSALALNNLGAIAIKATAPIITGFTSVLSVANELLSAFNDLPSGYVAAFGVLATGVAFAVIVKKLRELIAAFLESRQAAIASAEGIQALVLAQREATAAAAGMTLAEFEATNALRTLAVAETETAAATGLLATATGAFGKVMGFLGGPLGIAILAFTAIPALLDAMGVSSSGAAAEMDKLQTAVNETKGKIDAYDATITSVEQEIDRLADKSADLTKNKAELGTEVARLTGRFSGLSGEINGTETSINGLIAGMERFIVLQRQARLGQQVAQSIQLDQQTNAASDQNRQLGEKYGGGFGYALTQRVHLTAAARTADDRATGIINGSIKLDDTALPAELAKITEALGRSSRVVADLATFIANRAKIAENGFAKRTLIGDQIDKGKLQVSGGYSTLETRLSTKSVDYKTGKLGKTDYADYLKDQVKFFDAELGKPYNKSAGNQQAISEIRNKANDALQELLKVDADDADKDAKAQKKLDAEQRKKDAAERKRKSELYVNKESDSELKALEDEARAPTTFVDLAEKRDEYDQVAKAYVAGKLAQAADELSKKTGLSADDQADFLAQARTDAENRVRQFYAKINSSVTKGLQATLDSALKGIDDAAGIQSQPGKLRLAKLDGQIAGLDNPDVKGRVPDYTRQFYAKQREQEAARQRPIDIATLNDKADAISKLKADAVFGTQDPNASPADKAEAVKALADLNTKLREIEATRAQLIAQNDQSIIPTSFTQGLGQAASVWRDNNDAALTFSQTLTKNLGGAFDVVQSGAESFFTNIADGSKSVLGAFGGFVQSMGKYLEQLAFKFAATKLIDFGLSLVSGGGGLNGLSFGDFNGGFAGVGNPIKRLGGGNVAPSGRVVNGEAGRDSVNTELARGEFVVRKKAVDSVGAQFMNDLNKYGAAALAPRAEPMVSMPAPRPSDPVNVYVVAPEEKPQMGPRDVLATVHRDILDGGQTKKLIHSVQRGG